jgi:nucleoside-diphosphate kinase
MAHERTFFMIKPGVLQRKLVGEVIARIERKGFQIAGMKMMHLSRELCETHYAEHKGKSFYEPLVEYMITAPVIAMVVEGENAILGLRALCGATNPEEATPGTIRGDLALITRMNIVHASDSPESASRELGLFFEDGEIYGYEDETAKWVR